MNFGAAQANRQKLKVIIYNGSYTVVVVVIVIIYELIISNRAHRYSGLNKVTLALFYCHFSGGLNVQCDTVG